MKKSHLGEAVRFHRKKSGLTQIELARMAGVGKSAVFDLEKNKQSVRYDTILKILTVLNIELRLVSPLMKEFEKAKNEKG